MALFGSNNQEKQQKQMFDAEMQQTREENAVKYSDVGDDVYFAQKEKNEDLTKWQQDMENDIERTVHDLKREIESDDGYKRMTRVEFVRINKDGKKIGKKVKVKPMMNNLGINMFRGAIRPLISRNLMMSSYSEDKIYVKLRSIMFTFISHLAYHQRTYDMIRLTCQ